MANGDDEAAGRTGDELDSWDWGQKLVRIMSRQHMSALVVCTTAICSAVPSAWFLMDSDVSFIPVFLIVVSGMSVVLLAGATLRLRAAKVVVEEIEKAGVSGTGNVLGQGLTQALLAKVLEERRMLAAVKAGT